MVTMRTNFSPQVHGYKFVNRFEVPLSVMFPLPFVGPLNVRDVVYGLCGGMCFASLDYFNAGQPVPGFRRVEDLETDYLLYLWDRQLDSLKLPVLLKVIEWMVLPDRDIGTRMSRWEVPKLRRRIDKGSPAVLALIRTSGLSDPTQNHQVMATSYTFAPDTKDMVIDLYDPNHPENEVKLNLNLAKPSSGTGISQSTGEALKGFFVIEYRKQKPRV